MKSSFEVSEEVMLAMEESGKVWDAYMPVLQWTHSFRVTGDIKEKVPDGKSLRKAPCECLVVVDALDTAKI